jgi:hypothetical protein
MEKETGFSETESLQIIHSMINRAKNRFSEDGFLYLLWGWVVLLCSVTQYMLLKFTTFQQHYLVWMLTWAAVVYQVFYLNRKHRKKQVRTYTDDIVKYVWISFAIAIFIMGFLFGRILGPDYYKMMDAGFLVLYGIPTFMSGIILRFRPLVIGGIACWALSILAAFVASVEQLLFISAAMIVAWIIPGYLIRSKYKKANA